ncbi:MAG: hypothetical protein OHK0031_13080 [Anaerolineales bacterium]
MKWLLFSLAGFLFLTACAPLETETPTPLSIFASPSASPWLEAAYDCAPQAGAVLRLADDPAQADLRLRLGAPAAQDSPAFVLGEEEIIVAASPKNSLALTDAAAAREFLAGGGGTLWLLDSDDETRIFLETGLMLGRPLSPLARLATSPQEMAQALAADENAVGVLGQHSAGDLRVIFSAGKLPVLAETSSPPAGVLRSLLACMQGKSAASLPPEPAG